MAKEVPEKIRVEVNKEHIDRGFKGDPACCMVAIALKDQGHEEVRVYHRSSKVDGVSYKHPKCAVEKIKTFDLYKPVEPFGFEMERVRRRKKETVK